MSEITNPLYGKFEEVVDALAAAPIKPEVASWDARAMDVVAERDVRLDAGSYAPMVMTTLDALALQCEDMVALGSLARVSYGQRFERIYTDDPEQGVPYFNPTDLLSLMAFGIPPKNRYLSPATKTDITRLVVRPGWLLLTCSGSVSRVFYVGRRMDGWAATHDIVRIVPHDENLTGYLYAWLSTPEAKTHITGRQHGGVVQHLTAKQVSESLVPRLGVSEEIRINRAVMRALLAREEAIETLTSAWPL